MTTTRDLQIELARFNGANERARREYDTNPTAACYAHDCPELAMTGDVVCREHRNQRTAAAARMRGLRAKKETP